MLFQVNLKKAKQILILLVEEHMRTQTTALLLEVARCNWVVLVINHIFFFVMVYFHCHLFMALYK